MECIVGDGSQTHEVSITIYRLQIESGRHFIHEHPKSASIWTSPEITQFISEIGVDGIVGRVCRFGMKSDDGMGDGAV